MSKKHKRKPITTSKPQPAICSCDQGKLYEEVKVLRTKLEAQQSETECYKRLYDTAIDTQINVTRKMYALRALKDEAEIRLTAAKSELNYYRRAFKIINIILTVGFAVITAILIWR